MMTVQQAFDLALQHHRAGRLAEAETLYRQLLSAQGASSHFAAWPAHECGNQLGILLAQTGRAAEAENAFRRALEVKPDFAGARGNLGIILAQQQRYPEAIEAYTRALELSGDDAATHSNLAVALLEVGRIPEAEAACLRALQLKPDLPEGHYNLGNVLAARGSLDQAVAAYQRALQLRPPYEDAWNNLGIALADGGKLDAAVAAYRHALALNPGRAHTHTNLGNALHRFGQSDAAIAAHREAIRLEPTLSEAFSNLGNIFKDLGQLDAALAEYRRGIEVRPDDVAAHSNLIYTLQFQPGCEERDIAEELARWSRRFAEPLKASIPPHTNDRDPDRRLRIGYVSPDFYFQAEAHFVVPLLEAHDHREFEIHCYSSVVRPDAVTERLRRAADAWHDVRNLSDAELAQQIRHDQIDILVDLTMHMANHRLLVFARKPAPVQATWLAYPGSTGLETMDYRITDDYLEPSSIDLYPERPMRLRGCWCCYDPLGDEVPINALPAREAGWITFGCLNNFCKINEEVIALFADVMRRVEKSHLLLLVPDGSARQRVADQFERHGVARDRLEFAGKTPRAEYLKLYHRIDIALDTLPYNGITTTCDALWMGVPVVTCVGRTAAGRAGAGLLLMMDLPILITMKPEQFVVTADFISRDLSQLECYRESLRSRMEASSLMQARRFARDMEAAYRSMWRRWCEPGTGK